MQSYGSFYLVLVFNFILQFTFPLFPYFPCDFLYGEAVGVVVVDAGFGFFEAEFLVAFGEGVDEFHEAVYFVLAFEFGDGAEGDDGFVAGGEPLGKELGLSYDAEGCLL